METTAKEIILDQFDMEQLADIAEHVDAGWPGYTTYAETSEFYRAHRGEIIAAVEAMADEFGQGVVDFVRSLGRGGQISAFTQAEVARVMYAPLDTLDSIEYGYQVENWLTWFFLEQVAREAVDTGD